MLRSIPVTWFKIASILTLLFPIALATAGQHRLNLPKSAPQGALVIGQAEAGAEIRYAERLLHVGRDGVFVFGVERDSAKQVKLDLRYGDGFKKTAILQVKQRNYAIERVDGLPQHTVTPDPQIAARIADEQAKVAKARLLDDAREDFRHGFLLPAQGRVSGVYGSQRIDNGIAKAPHFGLDIAVPSGTPIHAPAAGLVTLAEPDFILTGGTVLIDHGYGLSSSFLHMSRIDVKEGERVIQGQAIGAVGATGRASGPHLHWGFNWFDVRLDPALLPKPNDH